MSIKLTQITRGRLVTWQIDNLTEGTSIQLSNKDFRELVTQGSEALEFADKEGQS